MIFGGNQYNYFTASPHIEHLKTSPHIECKSVFKEVLLPQRTPDMFSIFFLRTVCQMILGALNGKMDKM